MRITLEAEPALNTAFRLFQSEVGSHLFVIDGSRIYDVEPAVAALLGGCLAAEASATSDSQALLADLGLLAAAAGHRYIDDQPLTPPPLYSLSLNVAQACNMACGYCYADMGKFGGHARLMDFAVAKTSVDRLIAESAPETDLVLGFMGGEPLLNRTLIQQTTRYAASVAANAGRRIRFSLTTNATLLQQEDAELFAAFPFTIAVSIDGSRSSHDALRLMNDGSSSYDRLCRGLDLLNRYGRPRHLSARVTVTPQSGELLPVLDHIIGLGFDEVGFAAVLVSPNPTFAFGPADYPRFLEQMRTCGRKALNEWQAGRTYPFGNLEMALHQLHRGSHRPYPCGAGAAYLSANAEGDLFACHRLIDDPQFAMGNVYTGSDTTARTRHLAQRHVDRMEPCRHCWARYLCGGGCYHEVERRGRLGCDYIRGWLEFCLQAYAELSTVRPAYFTAATNRLTHHISSPTTIAS